LRIFHNRRSRWRVETLNSARDIRAPNQGIPRYWCLVRTRS
jgi:hypothetical protein